MLHELTLCNWRGFKRQTFQFAKINIFVGANNTGKSSVLSALNFLAQSLQQSEAHSGPIALNGSFEQLGTFLDVVHGHRANTPITFELVYGHHSRKHKIVFQIKYRRQRRITEISSFSFISRGRTVYSYRTKRDSFEARVFNKKLDALVPSSVGRPRFLTFFPIDRTLQNYGFSFENDQNRSSINPEVRQLLRKADSEMRRGRLDLRNSLSRFDSISPFRDQPQRTYLFTGETPSKIGRTGSNTISLIVNDASKRGRLSTDLLKGISQFFIDSKISKGIQLRQLTQRHFEICLLDLDNTQHNICDVGFGCAQVLPVLVGGLNILSHSGGAAEPIFLVQEPEIHLHPNAQAELGNFFVTLAEKGSQLFVETHSDNLVLRVMTLIASKRIAPRAVSLFLCESKSNGKTVKRLSLDIDGSFKAKWPGGFFPQREKESLALMRARRTLSSGS